MYSSISNSITLARASSSSPKTYIPRLVYGTAWKKDQTKELVLSALQNGFRGVDVAAQPRHYREDLVGAALRDCLGTRTLKREDLYIQTKFTSFGGQDPDNMPYNPGSPIPDQVRASINSSLHNLRSSEGTNPSGDTSYIDCLVLHSPLPTYAETLEAWETFEEFVPHHVRTLGISNTTLPLLEALYDAARVKPSVVQNRFYATTGFDKTLRRFCRDKGIVYQSFWTLTANSQLLNSRPISSLAEAMRIDKAAALYALVLGLGNTVVLDGTSNETRMKADVNAIARLSEWIVLHEREWQNVFEDFKKLINES